MEKNRGGNPKSTLRNFLLLLLLFTIHMEMFSSSSSSCSCSFLIVCRKNYLCNQQERKKKRSNEWNERGLGPRHHRIDHKVIFKSFLKKGILYYAMNPTNYK